MNAALLILFGFFDGTSDPIPPPAETPAAGGVGRHRRRRVIIDEVIYEGTEEQIEAKLWELLDAQREEPPPKKARKKLKAANKPVALKADYTPPPLVLNMPRYEQFVADSFRHEDVFLRSLLKAMIRRREEDEDDIEALLLAL